MINAAELRIGNKILSNANKIVVVTGIVKGGQVTVVHWNDGHCMSGLCSPIPLTPEILEICGFIENKEFSEVMGRFAKQVVLDIPLFRPDGSKFDTPTKLGFTYNVEPPHEMFGEYTVDGFYASRRIEYLHQLQNLYYALTGAEMPITDPAWKS
jgi:hypothetical protein